MINHNVQLIKLKDRSQEWKDFDIRLHMMHELVTMIYMWPGCGCGGPLHIVLDDHNFRDSDLNFCAEELQKDKWTGIREIGKALLELLQTLSNAQRCYWSQWRETDEVLAVAGKEAEWDNEKQDWKIKE